MTKTSRVAQFAALENLGIALRTPGFRVYTRSAGGPGAGNTIGVARLFVTNIEEGQAANTTDLYIAERGLVTVDGDFLEVLDDLSPVKITGDAFVVVNPDD